MNDRQMNEALHQFLVARSGQMTEEWLVSPEEVKKNPYVSNAKLDQILQEMKQTFSTEWMKVAFRIIFANKQKKL